MFERQRAASVEPGEATAFIGKGSRISGTVVLEGGGRIEGVVDGEITAGALLTVGESAVVSAGVRGTTVVVHGRVTGDVTVSERLEVLPTGAVCGNVRAPRLIIHEGARLEGGCAMGGDGALAEASPREASILLRGDSPPSGAIS
jgi:cytoskeletal protein CcmA (bactofilin family)